MSSTSITFEPIGVVHSPFKEPGEVPRQPLDPLKTRGTIELKTEYVEGLADLDGFSHIMVIFHLHRSEDYRLKLKPHLDNEPRGLFATRSPRRPNPIGVSVVGLERIEGNRLWGDLLDILDDTPLLDLKPYIPPFEGSQKVSLGWLTGKVDRVRGDWR